MDILARLHYHCLSKTYNGPLMYDLFVESKIFVVDTGLDYLFPTVPNAGRVAC